MVLLISISICPFGSRLGSLGSRAKVRCSMATRLVVAPELVPLGWSRTVSGLLAFLVLRLMNIYRGRNLQFPPNAGPVPRPLERVAIKAVLILTTNGCRMSMVRLGVRLLVNCYVRVWVRVWVLLTVPNIVGVLLVSRSTSSETAGLEVIGLNMVGLECSRVVLVK